MSGRLEYRVSQGLSLWGEPVWTVERWRVLSWETVRNHDGSVLTFSSELRALEALRVLEGGEWPMKGGTQLRI